jgi:hypothetical protein
VGNEWGPWNGHGSSAIKIENTRPVELTDLTTSLSSLAAQFRRFAEMNGYDIERDELRLFVKEIRSGSIEAELMALAANLPMLVHYTGAVIGFAKDLQSTYEFFLGKTGTEPPAKDAQDYRNMAGILQSVVHDSGAQFNIAAKDNAQVFVNIGIGSTEANAIHNRISNRIARMAEPISGLKEGQLFYWYQARNDPRSQAGDRGIIEAISKRPVKVRFSSEEVKSAMLKGEVFHLVYVVDVDVQTVSGKPALYKILAVHDSFSKEDDSSTPALPGS